MPCDPNDEDIYRKCTPWPRRAWSIVRFGEWIGFPRSRRHALGGACDKMGAIQQENAVQQHTYLQAMRLKKIER
jgi:hypothetical protein